MTRIILLILSTVFLLLGGLWTFEGHREAIPFLVVGIAGFVYALTKKTA